MKRSLSEIKCFLIDMDGTVYLGNKLIPGAIEAIERMRKQGRVIFLTNNSSKGRADYAEKLNRLGFAATKEDVITSGTVMMGYLNRHHAGKKIFLLGNELLTREFKESGIEIDNENPDIVVVAFDTGFTYETLNAACSFIRKGVPFFATHPDLNCPTEHGDMVDVGAFLALIKASTGFSPSVITGKPYTPMGDTVEAVTGLDHNEIAMIGDRMSTDMLFALNNAYLPILVLTGDATRDDLEMSGYDIPYVLGSIDEILK